MTNLIKIPKIVKAVIFDYYGTLVTTNYEFNYGVEKLVKKLNQSKKILAISSDSESVLNNLSVMKKKEGFDLSAYFKDNIFCGPEHLILDYGFDIKNLDEILNKHRLHAFESVFVGNDDFERDSRSATAFGIPFIQVHPGFQMDKLY